MSQDQNSVQGPVFSSIKDIRLTLDKFINSVRFIRQSREVSLTHTSLQRAFMWLGEALKASGSASPYVTSEDPSVKTIEPQAEKTKDTLMDRWTILEDTHTARVKDFRFIIQEAINGFKEWRKNAESAGHSYDECLNQSWVALKEAKLWLGWELARIRDIQENSNIPSGDARELPL